MTALRRQWHRLTGCILWLTHPGQRSDVVAEAEAIRAGLAW